MFKNVSHVAVMQGPQGPDGPLGETGPEGPKVNLHTILLKTSLHACEDGINMAPSHDICHSCILATVLELELLVY